MTRIHTNALKNAFAQRQDNIFTLAILVAIEVLLVVSVIWISTSVLTLRSLAK